MLVHAGCSDLVYWCITSLERAWNFHGTCISPASVRTHDKHDGTNMCRYRQHLQNLHGAGMKSTSIVHANCMELPGKVYQLERAMQPPRLDTRNNGTYMTPPWNLHQFSMKPLFPFSFILIYVLQSCRVINTEWQHTFAAPVCVQKSADQHPATADHALMQEKMLPHQRRETKLTRGQRKRIYIYI